jgi:hypothetical protein
MPHLQDGKIWAARKSPVAQPEPPTKIHEAEPDPRPPAVMFVTTEQGRPVVDDRRIERPGEHVPRGGVRGPRCPGAGGDREQRRNGLLLLGQPAQRLAHQVAPSSSASKYLTTSSPVILSTAATVVLSLRRLRGTSRRS